MKVAENVYSIRYNADRTAYASDLVEIEEAISAEEKRSGRPYYLCGVVYEPGIAGEWKYGGHYSCDSNLSPNVCYKGFEGVRYVLIGNYSIDEALAMIDAAEKQNEKKEETKMTKTTTNNWESYKDAIELGMTDGDATRAVCAEYVSRMSGRFSTLYDLRNEKNESCDEKGRAITGEPPICVLSNLDAARTVRVNLRNDVTLVKTLIDWSEVDANDLASCVLSDGWLENDEIPTEFVETDEDGEPRDVDDDKRRLIETVLWAVSDDANGQRWEHLEIVEDDPLYIEGDRFDDVYDEYESKVDRYHGAILVKWGARSSSNIETTSFYFLPSKNTWYKVCGDGSLCSSCDDVPDLPLVDAREWWCSVREISLEKEDELLATLEEEEE